MAADISFAGFSPDEIISSEKNGLRGSPDNDKFGNLDSPEGLAGFVEHQNLQLS
jgi:hypothetical protein